MDIYSYLNSNDIAAYCRNINHQFNALESVFIIYYCRHISVETKHRLYRIIMQEMPDMNLSQHQRLRWRENLLYPESLFDALHEFISDQEQMLHTLKTSSHAVYSYAWTEKGYEATRAKFFYSGYDKANQALISELHEDSDFSMDDVASCEITMHIMDEHKFITAELNADQKIFFIDSSGFSFDSPLLRNLWAYIPTPFHKGDILINPQSRRPEPFVLDHIHYEGRPESFFQWMNSQWDDSDLLAWGFYDMDDWAIDTPCEIWGYQDLEYYCGEVSPVLNDIQNKIRNHEV